MAEHTFTDQNFAAEVEGANTPVLVDFWAPWCGPCKIVGPIVEEIANEMVGKLKVGKLNVDENPQVASKYGIMSIPTLMVFKDGKVAKTMVGAQPKESIVSGVQEVL